MVVWKGYLMFLFEEYLQAKAENAIRLKTSKYGGFMIDGGL